MEESGSGRGKKRGREVDGGEEEGEAEEVATSGDLV